MMPCMTRRATRRETSDHRSDGPAEKPVNAKRRATREALIRAGQDLVLEREGLGFPTMKEVADRAGLSRGAFQANFESRDDFAAAVVETLLTDVIAEVLTVPTRSTHDPAEAVIHLFSPSDTADDSGQADALRHAYTTALLLMSRLEGLRERHAEIMRDVVDRLELVIHRGRDSGRFAAEVDAHELALFLGTVAIGQLLVSAGEGPESATGHAGTAFLDLVKARPSRS